LRLGAYGIGVRGWHGVDRAERRRGNRFAIDVELTDVPSGAVETDAVADTVDYRDVVTLIRAISTRQAFDLIESLAGAIAEGLLAAFPEVPEVFVRVWKLKPPGLGRVDCTMAEVRRWRE